MAVAVTSARPMWVISQIISPPFAGFVSKSTVQVLVLVVADWGPAALW
jgi:hypothetical protein